jgi:hypothetical protein
MIRKFSFAFLAVSLAVGLVVVLSPAIAADGPSEGCDWVNDLPDYALYWAGAPLPLDFRAGETITFQGDLPITETPVPTLLTLKVNGFIVDTAGFPRNAPLYFPDRPHGGVYHVGERYPRQ